MRFSEAVVAVTYRCNCRCSMCNIWTNTEHFEMQPGEYAKLPLSLRTINVSGGEPFMRADLLQCVRVIHTRLPKSRIVISSNGILTERIVNTMREIQGFHRRIGIGVSIDGLRSVHERLRGVPGAFDRAVRTVESLRDQGIGDIRLGMTISHDNLDEVGRVNDLSKRLGVGFTTTLAHNSDIYFKKSDNRSIADAPGLDEAINPLMHSQLTSRSPKDWLRAYHTRGMVDRGVREAYSSDCRAGRDYFFMAPNGDIFPCNVMDFRIGNLAEVNSWNEIFTPGMRGKLDAAVESCRRDCWMICNTRSLIKRHPVKVGLWVAGNKLRAHLNR